MSIDFYFVPVTALDDGDVKMNEKCFKNNDLLLAWDSGLDREIYT